MCVCVCVDGFNQCLFVQVAAVGLFQLVTLDLGGNLYMSDTHLITRDGNLNTVTRGTIRTLASDNFLKNHIRSLNFHHNQTRFHSF